MNLEPYRRVHLNTFKPAMHDEIYTSELRMTQGWEGKAVSFREDDKTLGICGISVTGGAALVWAVLSAELRKRPIEISRMAKETIPVVMDMPGVERIEIETSWPGATKWAEWLGFKHENGKMIWRHSAVQP